MLRFMAVRISWNQHIAQDYYQPYESNPVIENISVPQRLKTTTVHHQPYERQTERLPNQTFVLPLGAIRHLIRTSKVLAMQPSGEAVPLVVQLTGLTGLEGTFGQWYVSVGGVGFSDKAAMHRRRHAASVVSHGFVAVDAYQRVEVVLMGRLLKCGDAPSVDGMKYHIRLNTTNHHFLSKQRNTSKFRSQSPNTSIATSTTTSNHQPQQHTQCPARPSSSATTLLPPPHNQRAAPPHVLATATTAP